MSNYYKVNKKIADQIRKMDDDFKVLFEVADRYAKGLGALGLYKSKRWGVVFMSGFQFKEVPDRSLFVRLKGTEDGWCPRANSPLRREMGHFQSDYILKVMHLVGLNMMDSSGWYTAGITVVESGVYIVVPEHAVPKCCRRVSDITYKKAISAVRK